MAPTFTNHVQEVFVLIQEQYSFLYAAMLDHVSSNLVYENFGSSAVRPAKAGRTENVYSNMEVL